MAGPSRSLEKGVPSLSGDPPSTPPTVRVVIDANALIALVAREPESEMVARHIAAWICASVELHTPELARYEVANALTRKASAGELEQADLPAVWAELEDMPITYWPLSDATEAMKIALQLQRRSAFDSSYVALAQALDAELWTLDGPLARNAASHELPVKLIKAQEQEPAGEIVDDDIDKAT